MARGPKGAAKRCAFPEPGAPKRCAIPKLSQPRGLVGVFFVGFHKLESSDTAWAFATAHLISRSALLSGTVVAFATARVIARSALLSATAVAFATLDTEEGLLVAWGRKILVFH